MLEQEIYLHIYRMSGLSGMNIRNSNVSLSTFQHTPSALSTGSASNVKSSPLTSRALSSSGIVANTRRELVIHFVRLKPPLSSSFFISATTVLASSSFFTDVRQLST